jgi:hypothetical protein
LIEVWKTAQDPVDRNQQVLDCLNRRVRGTKVDTIEDYLDNWGARWKVLAQEVADELGARLIIDDETTTFDFCPPTLEN